MDERATPRWRRTATALLPGMRRTVVLALSCNLLLEVVQVAAVDGYPWRFKAPTYPLLFLLGTAAIWLLVGLVHVVVGRLWLSAAITLSATCCVAIADLQKLRLRREPLLPSDAEFAGDLGFVTDMVGPGLILVMVLSVVAVTAAAFLAARAAGRRIPGPAGQGLGRGVRLGLRVLTGSVCMLSLTYLAGFNTPGNAAHVAYDALGAQWRPWSQQRNYLGNGFVGGFLYNLDIPPVAPPPGYDAATMERVSARYTDAAEKINRTRHGSIRDVNVILALSESFSDPLALDEVHLGRDPIPFTRALMSRTQSGRMLAQGVGGGTANMEFEALTGMSMAQLPAQVRTPYQMLVPEYSTFPSAVGWFGAAGHRTVAIHPFTTEMYRRREVYRAFGFDEFVYNATMQRTTTSGEDGFISDAAAFEEIRRRLVSSTDPLFVNLVTMQNHMPYPGRYDAPVRVTGPGGRPLPEVGQYARGLAVTDRALADFVAELERLEEPTVLVFYGDHLPSSYPDAVFDANGRRTMHQTPYFVWANFAGPEPSRRAASPTVSPTHFVGMALQRADAPVSPYYALLHQLRQQVPAMDTGMMFGPGGRRLHRADLPARTERLLRDHRLVQYDLSVGERFSAAAMLATG